MKSEYKKHAFLLTKVSPILKSSLVRPELCFLKCDKNNNVYYFIAAEEENISSFFAVPMYAE